MRSTPYHWFTLIDMTLDEEAIYARLLSEVMKVERTEFECQQRSAIFDRIEMESTIEKEEVNPLLNHGLHLYLGQILS